VRIGTWAFGHSRKILDKGSAQILQTGRPHVSAVTLNGEKFAHTAIRSYGVTVCPHWFHDLHAQLVAATPNARYVESSPNDQVPQFSASHLYATENKRRHADSAENAGPRVGFDEKAVARYALQRRTSVWTMLKVK